MENGSTIKCTVEVCLPGQMEESMMESTMMTRNKVMEFSLGQMVGDTKATGLMENNMDRVYIILAKEKQREENGKKARE